MSQYRRIRSKGASYFFTVNLADRRSALLVDRVDALRDAVARTRAERPFWIDAMVVLPDHLHAVWTLPEGNADYSTRWRLIKARFVQEMEADMPRSRSKRAKGERGIWQRRFWEHCIRDDADYRAHVAYCWTNPVKHGLVERAVDWPHSSIHRDIRRGLVGPEYVGWVVHDGGAGGVHPPIGERREDNVGFRGGG